MPGESAGSRRECVILGGCFLAFCTAVLAVGKFEMGFGIEALRTLSVVGIVYASQATLYAIRGRHHLWGLRPTIWLVLSSIADLLIISTLAIRGIAMAPLPISVVAGEFAAAIVFGLILVGVKMPVFARLGISYVRPRFSGTSAGRVVRAESG
jgi:H+-transporting ATPase